MKTSEQNHISYINKLHFVVLHPLGGEGGPFKIVGYLDDVKLIMLIAAESILSPMRTKMIDILHTRIYYSTADLINQCKVHVEYR